MICVHDAAESWSLTFKSRACDSSFPLLPEKGLLYEELFGRLRKIDTDR
jgi:hypothetical protein